MFRKSIRVKSYDYSNEGYYFITICTHFKQHTLGTIDGNGSELSSFGRIALLCWENISKSFKTVQLDAFIVMPNHIHGIVRLSKSGEVALPTIIQNFKSVTTRRINNLRKTPAGAVWQRNYYERIIRTERELNMVRLYISFNPTLWHKHVELAEINLTEEKISGLLEKFRSEV